MIQRQLAKATKPPKNQIQNLKIHSLKLWYPDNIYDFTIVELNKFVIALNNNIYVYICFPQKRV